MHALLERDTNGVHVEVALATTGHIVLICQHDTCKATRIVPPDKAFDAFEHPAIYLGNEQADAIFNSRA